LAIKRSNLVTPDVNFAAYDLRFAFYDKAFPLETEVQPDIKCLFPIARLRFYKKMNFFNFFLK